MAVRREKMTLWDKKSIEHQIRELVERMNTLEERLETPPAQPHKAPPTIPTLPAITPGEDPRWRQMAGSLPDLMLLVKPDGTVVFSNHSHCVLAGCDLKGVSLQGLIGKTAWGSVRRCLDRVMESHQCDQCEVDLHLEDSTRLLYEVTMAPVEQQGKVDLVSLCCRNVTDRRIMDRRLSQISRLDGLMVLAGGVAHDFNNLLTGMMGHLGLAKIELPDDSPVHEHLEEIEQIARAARDLANQMRAYSGRGNFEMSQLNLSACVREQEAALKALCPEPTKLQFDLPEFLPAQCGDQTQIGLLLGHLLTNAHQALGGKPGRVILRTGFWKVPVGSLLICASGDAIDPGDYTFIEVADEGCGMDEEALQRAFDPFYSGFGGRGLGLSACLGIARAHGGGILVESVPEVGTRLRVLIPHRSPAEIPCAETPPKAPFPLAELGRMEGAHVLLVDDEPIIRSTSGTILEKAGICLQVAGSAHQALDVLNYAGENLDLMLVDLTMPGMSGAALLRRVRESFPHLPVILSSGYSRQEAMQGLEDLGEIPFLEKPYELPDLIRAVAGNLPKHRRSD